MNEQVSILWKLSTSAIYFSCKSLCFGLILVLTLSCFSYTKTKSREKFLSLYFLNRKRFYYLRISFCCVRFQEVFIAINKRTHRFTRVEFCNIAKPNWISHFVFIVEKRKQLDDFAFFFHLFYMKLLNSDVTWYKYQFELLGALAICLLEFIFGGKCLWLVFLSFFSFSLSRDTFGYK